jgi:hypothetical protein
MQAMADDIANLGFLGLDITPTSTLEDWREMADHEFQLKQLAAVILKYNDTELAERVRQGDPEHWLELATAFADLQKRYESGAQVCGACFARLFVVLEREFPEEPETHL